MHKLIRSCLPMVGVAIAILPYSNAIAKNERLEILSPCALPLTMPDQPKEMMVSMGDLQITYDQHIFWKGQEVILYQNHSQTFHRQHKNSDYLFRVLLALVDSPNQALS